MFGLSRELKYENKSCRFLVIIRNGDTRNMPICTDKKSSKMTSVQSKKNPQFMWNAATEEETAQKTLGYFSDEKE